MSERSPPPAPPQRILVIDDEAVVCLSCLRALSEAGHEVDYRQDPRQGLTAALSGGYDIILLDLVMPEMNGLELLARLRDSSVASEIVIITGYSTVQTAVEAMQRGAADYVSKPFGPDELKMTIAKVCERSALLRENAALRRELEQCRGFAGIIGESRPMERVFAIIKRVAPTDGTVLVTGESGTGKELVARAVHQLSARRDRPFLVCDCTALASTLLESELFGHVKGSFTGAITTTQGLFEAADGGTLFLDEISNLSLETQAKLLRVLETRRVRKVGDTVEQGVEFRLIAAANRNLEEMMRAGAFRQDLYYRLNVIPIQVPPLRERDGDIPRLAVAFLEGYRARGDVTANGFSLEAMQALERHRWPGNVRELKNMVERLAILCDEERIQARHLPAEMRCSQGLPGAQPPLSWRELKHLKQKIRDEAVRELEQRFLLEALARNHGNVSRAAAEVGMQRSNFHALMRRHALASERQAQGSPDDKDPAPRQ